MTCEIARALIDDGARAQDSPELAGHLAGCHECRRVYQAESLLSGAVAADRIRASRRLEQALLAIPVRERRLHLLAPAMVPLAGVACGIGALVVALALRGQGEQITIHVPSGTATSIASPEVGAPAGPTATSGRRAGPLSAPVAPSAAATNLRSPLGGTVAPVPTLLAMGPRATERGGDAPRAPRRTPTPGGSGDSTAPATPVPTLDPGEGDIAPGPIGTPTPPGAAPGPPEPTATDPSRRDPPTRAPVPPQPSPSMAPGTPTPTRTGDFPPAPTPGVTGTSDPLPTASPPPPATASPTATASATPTPSPTSTPTRTPSPTATPL